MIQTKLSYYQVWIAGESAVVGDAYANLVRELRQVAGNACHEAWKAGAVREDKEMNIGPGLVDLSELAQHEQVYIGAVQQHLDDFLKLHSLFRAARRAVSLSSTSPRHGAGP